MRQNNSITQDELKQLMEYNPETGNLIWKVSRGKSKVGKVAGRTTAEGYIQIGIYGNQYQAHRLVWLYVYGEFPEYAIDHIDGDKANNTISNLRICPRNMKDNGQNRKTHKNNTSGYPGVHFVKQQQNYRASIMADGKKYILGRFNTAELAYEARLNAQKDLWQFQPEPRR